jgi:hypothetical protein
MSPLIAAETHEVPDAIKRFPDVAVVVPSTAPLICEALTTPVPEKVSVAPDPTVIVAEVFVPFVIPEKGTEVAGIELQLVPSS